MFLKSCKRASKNMNFVETHRTSFVFAKNAQCFHSNKKTRNKASTAKKKCGRPPQQKKRARPPQQKNKRGRPPQQKKRARIPQQKAGTAKEKTLLPLTVHTCRLMGSPPPSLPSKQICTSKRQPLDRHLLCSAIEGMGTAGFNG